MPTSATVTQRCITFELELCTSRFPFLLLTSCLQPKVAFVYITEVMQIEQYFHHKS